MEDVKCVLQPKSISRIEQAISNLEDVCESNRRLTRKIFNQIFTPAPEGNSPADCNDGEMTLGEAITRIASKVDETNDGLNEIYKVLIDQLGSIKLAK